MSKLSDDKLRKLDSLSNQGGFWYITKQNLVFRDLCFMAKILEAWNDRSDENYQSFFDRHKTLAGYGNLAPLTAHRATKNCEYLGLTKPSDKYSSRNLTPFYFALKDLCNGDFDKLSSYPNIVNKQLERIYIDSNVNNLYTIHIKICPFMFLFKILLLIGDITESYRIATSEFKLFVATAQSWNDYFEVVESILRYRNDPDYKMQCDANIAKVSDVRYNILAQNHSQLEVTSSEIAIKDGEVKNIRRKVAEYELDDSVQSAEDIFSSYFVSTFPLQQIFYGAPGTGKSHEIKERTKGQSVIRTTFHPDSDYSTFVGAYKPTMEETDALVVPVVVDKGISLEDTKTYKDKRIIYKFVKQAFLKAYLLAWKNYTDLKTVTSITDTTSTAERLDDEQDIITKAIQNEFNPNNNIKPDESPNQSDQDEHTTSKSKLIVTHSCKSVFLVIEEINRGNCAQIFGDLFQLLDRSDNGFSEYPIEADDDLQKEIERAFGEEADYKLVNNINVEGIVMDYTSNYGATLSEDIQHGRILLLPKNLYIWATMNTSDQSLFPIDSAFKRRWDWVYIPIDTHKEDWYIKVNNIEYSWPSFLDKINDEVLSDETAEDKHLGFYFCKAEDNIITAEKFVSKVLFYLWNDVFKVYGVPEMLTKGDKNMTFHKFYNTDGSINETLVAKLLDNIGVEKKVKEPTTESDSDETVSATE